jgi:hypothetical protein
MVAPATRAAAARVATTARRARRQRTCAIRLTIKQMQAVETAEDLEKLVEQLGA